LFPDCTEFVPVKNARQTFAPKQSSAPPLLCLYGGLRMPRVAGFPFVRMSLCLLTLIALVVAPVSLHAQLVRGAVSGTALDAQNASVPGVQVKLTNKDTGVTQTVTTNDVGFYRLAAVEPGSYAVEFSRNGFKTQKVGTVEVNSSKDTTVNATLEVGAQSAEVFVTVPGVELNKVEPTLRLTLTGTIVDETPLSSSSLVPLGSRNLLRYPLLAPAVARVPGQNETSANGHRGRENNYMIDGVENNDNTVTLPAIFMPPEAIREMHVQVAAYSAEFGHSIGAQVNATTKSGSNGFHGELWEFARNSALEPLSLSSRKAKMAKTPRLSHHQFGADLGGPIIKDRTFFFGIFQGNLQRQAAATLAAVTIPTPTGYAALLNAPLRPASGSVAAQSAASRAEILKALSFLPNFYPEVKNFTNITTTTTVNGTPIELGTFTPIIPQNQNVWFWGGRIDHHFANNNRFSYRASLDHRNSPLTGGNRTFGERWAADSLTFAQNHSVSYTAILGSNLVNESRLGYTRLDPSFPERDPVTSTTNIQSPVFTLGGLANFPQERLEETYQLQNVTSYNRGKHSLRIGFDLARTRLYNNSSTNSKGTWTFPTLESFLNSQPTSLGLLPFANGRFSFHQLRQAYFLQDDVKLRPNFTINIGLRYETASVPLGWFGATSQAEIDALVAAPGRKDKNNWAPRIGFAYSPDFTSGILGKMLGTGVSSIRGGFGIAYDVLYYSLLNASGGPSANYPRNPSLSPPLPANLIDFFPMLTPPVAVPPVLSSTTAFVNVPEDTQNPTSHFWSLSVQRQLGPDFVAELGYTASRSYHLLRQGQRNPGIISEAKAAAVRAGCTTPAAITAGCENPAGFSTSPTSSTQNVGRLNPQWGGRTLFESSGESSYNAMYLRVEKRLSNGLQFGANYTWSTNLSDSEDLLIGDLLLTGSSPANPQDFLDRRNEWARSALDRPHRFTVQYGYRIPGFENAEPVLKHVLSGWQISGFTELQSGQPFTIRVGMDVLGNGLSSAAAAGRPDYNPGGILTKDPVTGNLRTFVIPLDGTGIVTAPSVTNPTTGAITFLKNSMPKGGNLGRNTFRGPGFSNTNLSLSKRFSLPHELSLQLRGDFINVFNHDNFPNPDSNMSNITNGTFGTQTLTPLTDARQVLLGAKIIF
jgi:hypothetical protein